MEYLLDKTTSQQRNIITTPKKEDILNLLGGYIDFLSLQGSSLFYIPDDDRIFSLSEEVFKRVIDEIKINGYGNTDLLKIIEDISGKNLKENLAEYISLNLEDEDNPYIQRRFGLAFAPFISEDRKNLGIHLFFKLKFDENEEKLLIGEPVWNQDINENIQKNINSSEKSLPEILTDPDNLIKALEITWNVLSGLDTVSLGRFLNTGISLLFSLSVFEKLMKRLLPEKSLPCITDKPFINIPHSIFVFWYTDEVYTKRLLDELKKAKDNLNERTIKKLMNLWNRQKPSMADMETFKNYQLSFFENDLTESQKQAYRRILGQEITSIEGPPGTGKTHLIATYCMDMLIHNKRVLVTSTNNKAVDNVVEKLKQFDDSIKDILLTGRYLPGYIRISSGNEPARDELSQAIENFLSETHTEEEIKGNIEILEKEISMLKQIIDIPNRFYSKRESLKKISEDISTIKREITSQNEKLFSSLDKANAFSKENLFTFSELLDRLNKIYAFLPVISSFLKHSFISYALEKGIKISGQGDVKYITCRSIYKRNRELYEKLSNFIRHKESLWEKEWEEAQIYSEIKELESEMNRLCLELKLPENGYINEAKRRLIIRTKELNYWKLQGDNGYRKSLEDGIKIIKEGRLWNYTKEILKFSPIIIVTALSSPKVAPPNEDIFDTAIVDEGSQTFFIYALPAYLRSKKFVVIGDKHQLEPVKPPNILNRESLKKLFSQLPSHLHYLNSATETIEFIDSVDDSNRRLREHFRCHKDIIGFCDRLCNYGLEIKTADESYNFRIKLSNEVKELFEKPLVFINIDGKEEQSGYGSKRNKNEVRFIIKLVNKLKDFVEISDIGIITPYRGQSDLIKKEIRTVIRQLDLPAIGTVHIFQGDEREIIIMSTVCTNPHSLERSKLLNNKNLINVAVSRAKKHLILVGNQKALEMVHNDKSPIVMLYKHIIDKGKIISETLSLKGAKPL